MSTTSLRMTPRHLHQVCQSIKGHKAYWPHACASAGGAGGWNSRKQIIVGLLCRIFIFLLADVGFEQLYFHIWVKVSHSTRPQCDWPWLQLLSWHQTPGGALLENPHCRYCCDSTASWDHSNLGRVWSWAWYLQVGLDALLVSLVCSMPANLLHCIVHVLSAQLSTSVLLLPSVQSPALRLQHFCLLSSLQHINYSASAICQVYSTSIAVLVFCQVSGSSIPAPLSSFKSTAHLLQCFCLLSSVKSAQASLDHL